jgi:hypothetical protein
MTEIKTWTSRAEASAAPPLPRPEPSARLGLARSRPPTGPPWVAPKAPRSAARPRSGGRGETEGSALHKSEAAARAKAGWSRRGSLRRSAEDVKAVQPLAVRAHARVLAAIACLGSRGSERQERNRERERKRNREILCALERITGNGETRGGKDKQICSVTMAIDSNRKE